MNELLNTVVAFPVETQVAILGLVALVVTLAFDYIGTRVPWAVPFLMKWKEEITVALAGVLTGWLSTNLPGGVFEQASIWGVNFVVALLAALLAYGTLGVIRAARVKSLAG